MANHPSQRPTRVTPAATERAQIRSMAQSGATSIRQDLKSRRRLLTERQQLRAFEQDQAEGAPRLKALLDAGKLETARGWMNAMASLQIKAKRGHDA